MTQINKRKTSITSLIQSTFGPSLSLVPEGQDVSNLQSVETTTKAEAVGGQRNRPLNLESHSSNTPTNADSSPERVSLKRLHFNTKSSAGIESSTEQARLPKQDSISSACTMTSPSYVSGAYYTQSSRGSVVSSEAGAIGEEYAVQKSASISGLVPRPPTGSDWTRSKSPMEGTSDTVQIQEVLKDLDQKAIEHQERERVLSLKTDPSIGNSISWQEAAVSNQHIWYEVDSREACHLAETQYCQQLKLFHPKRGKVRCSACRVLVHTQCIKQLYYEGYVCKETFREIKQKVKDVNVTHHFLHRRKAGGKCTKCDRGFGNWRKFTGRDIVGISCSYCGDSYHLSCFNDRFKKEPCHFGPLGNLIIPPSWIVRTPAIEQSSAHSDASPKSSRRKTRRSRKRKQDDRASKYFTVKSLQQRQHQRKPLIVFINPKSGGNQGAKLMKTFQWLLNPRQVFDLSQGGPKFGLKLFQGVKDLRILACGGDGTAGWVLSVLDELEMSPTPPLAVLPLGTGNDLARVLNWGGGYTDEPIDKILMHVEEGPVAELDRWQLNVWPNPNAHEKEGAVDVPLHVINNYFSIGADAHVALEFHLEREANPEKLNNRFKNKFFYGRAAGKDMMLRRYSTLCDHIQLFCDGEDLTQKIRNLHLEAIVFQNIPSYGSGLNPWGTPSSRDKTFVPQAFDDGKIEIFGFWSLTMPKLLMGGHGERIAQCEHIKMVTDRSFPVQIDGEACKLQPSVIEVGNKNKVLVVRKVARQIAGAPLRGIQPTDRIKLSVSKVTCEQYNKLHSDIMEIRRAARPLGLIVAAPQESLKDLRPQIDKYTFEPDSEGGEILLFSNWRYLDVATSGRIDRMFQVLPDQEKSLFIEDMMLDGILVVEMETEPMLVTPGPGSAAPLILFSPEDESYSSLDLTFVRRKAYGGTGRSQSYELATVDDISSPKHNSASPPMLRSPVKDNLESPSSLTPVVSDDDIESLRLLNVVDTGSDSASTDNDVVGGQAPNALQKELLDAVKRGNVEKVKECHEKGAVLTVAEPNGWTPLHHAARLGKLEVVRYIATNIHKEAVDLVEEEKLQTALHKAAWFGYHEICMILMEKGASLSRRDYQGNTPCDKSAQSGDAELKMFMKKKEAERKKTDNDEVAI